MTFAYSSLRTDRQEVRLVTLQPGNDGDPVQLSIKRADLGRAGDYTCLSYAWGPPDPNRTVELNSCPFDVRENLYLALLRLRRRDKPRRLWIDALCINQDDVEEREAQVSIMQHIYDTATDVIAWIGEDNGAPDARAIDFIRDLGAKAESLTTVGPSGRPGDISSLDNDTVDWLESVTPFGLVDSVWLELTALIERPWFSRIWIVQEVVLGKEVAVQCGMHRFPWMRLFYCALFVNEHAQLINSLVAPQCLKFHDPKKSEFFERSLPLYRLLRAAANIRSVGHLAMTRRLHRHVRDMAEPSIRQWLARTPRADDEASRLWGMVSDQGYIQIFSTLPPNNTADPSAILPPAPVDDPAFVRHFLNNKAGRIVAIADGNVPIYSTIPNSEEKPPLDSHSLTLYSLLTRFRPFAATDPRDKVYALLGIAAEVEHIRGPFPTISYHPSTTILDVLWSVIATHLGTHADLDFLGDACGVDKKSVALGFPSWMPLWYDDMSHGDAKGAAVQLAGLEVSPGVVYRASGDAKAVAVMQRDSEGGVLEVAGRLLGRIRGLAEVFDRDVTKGETLALRRRWAEVLGVGELEKLNQVLTGLRLTKGISDEEADSRLEEVLNKLPQKVRKLYGQFVGTLMASVSEAGTDQLIHPKVGAKSLALTQMLGGGDRPRHFSHPWELHVDGRIANVCHGRRMFVCGLGDSGRNFGVCPGNTREGDLIALFLGSNVFHIIRPVGVVDGQRVFGLVGEAYVHDWMDGQLLETMRVPGCPDSWEMHMIKLR